jgi:hypothetical protein
MVLINFHTQYRRSVADGAGIVLQLDIDGNSIPASQAVGRVSAPNTTEDTLTQVSQIRVEL